MADVEQSVIEEHVLMMLDSYLTATTTGPAQFTGAASNVKAAGMAVAGVGAFAAMLL